MKRHRFWFYFLSFTWGSIMTVIGVIVALTLIIAGHKPKRWGNCICFNIGHNWGGVSFGPVMIVDDRDSEFTKWHEHGHAIQSCILGPLFPFVIGIPSVVRWWYRRWLIMSERRKANELPDYDSIWFESDANFLGEQAKKIHNTK